MKTFILFKNITRRGLDGLFAALGSGLLILGVFAGIKAAQNSATSPAVGLILREDSALSADLLSYMQNDLALRVTQSGDEKHLNDLLLDAQLSAIVELPQGYERAMLGGSEMQLVITMLGSYQNAYYIKAELNFWAESARTLANASGGDPSELTRLIALSRQNAAGVTQTDINAEAAQKRVNMDAFYVSVGFAAMIMFLLCYITAGSVWQDKTSGALARVYCSGASGASYALAVVAGGVAYGAATAGPLLIYVAASGIDTGANYLCFGGVLLTYSALLGALALLTALTAASKPIVMTIVVGGSSITSLLGGSFFPMDTAPQVLKALSRLAPQFWVTETLRHAGRGEAAGYGVSALVLALMTAVAFALVMARMAYKSR